MPHPQLVDIMDIRGSTVLTILAVELPAEAVFIDDDKKDEKHTHARSLRFSSIAPCILYLYILVFPHLCIA